MAIKAGQILHDANGFVVDRIQTGGISNLNIPEEKIYELGNFQTVATIRDIPDLSFEMESLDVSTEFEAILTGADPLTMADEDEFDFADSKPVDVLSPFKTGQGLFTIVKGLVIPYLTLESATYRFGNRENATQSFTLRGDSIYYIPGTPYYEEWALSGAGPYAFAHTALAYAESGDSVYALSICYTRTDGTYRRMARDEYTDTSTGFTFAAGFTPPTGAVIHAVYGSATAATYDQTVHQGVSVKPAAVRGKDIDVYVETAPLSGVLARWTSVQSFEVTRSVNLEADEEFGNKQYVAQDYDTAEVTGTVSIKPRDPADLWAKIHQVSNVASPGIVGPYTSTALAMELRINDPETGTRVKTLYIPDARIQPPAIQGRVQTKLETTFNFTSDGGNLLVYMGERP